MNDLPIADTPLDVQHLQIVNNGKHLPEEQTLPPENQFEFYISPFTYLLPVLLKSTSYYKDPAFGFNFQYDDILKIYFVNTIKPKYPDSKISYKPLSTNNKLRGSLVT